MIRRAVGPETKWRRDADIPVPRETLPRVSPVSDPIRTGGRGKLDLL